MPQPPRSKTDDDHDIIDPTEEVGPEECEPSATECEVAPGDLDAPPEGSQIPVNEELFEAYVPEPIVMVASPVDGLPVPAGEGDDLQTAPAYTHENLVCMEDARAYVEVLSEHPPRFFYHTRRPFNSNGKERVPLLFSPDRVERLNGMTCVRLTEQEIAIAFAGLVSPSEVKDSDPVHVLVKPIRPKCIHFNRQLLNIDGEDKMRVLFSNCAAKRSVGGAMMSLRDQAVYACDLREPRDPETEKLIADFDAKRLGTKVVRVPLFNMGVDEHLGIFGNKKG